MILPAKRKRKKQKRKQKLSPQVDRDGSVIKNKRPLHSAEVFFSQYHKIRQRSYLAQSLDAIGRMRGSRKLGMDLKYEAVVQMSS